MKSWLRIIHVKVGFIIIFLLPLVPRDASTTATILQPIIQVNLLVAQVIITMATVVRCQYFCVHSVQCA